MPTRAAGRITGFWRRRRIPLAWLLLTRQPMRLAVALAGIAFAGILMFMQLGFRDGLFEASVTIHMPRPGTARSNAYPASDDPGRLRWMPGPATSGLLAALNGSHAIVSESPSPRRTVPRTR